jgi:hypothetical protein
MMSAQDTSPQVTLDSSDVTVISRPCDELAVALYMSDMPDRQPKGDTWTLSQLAAWVLDGIATLGGTAETWRTAYRMRPAAEIGNWLEYRLFWDDPHREKTARRAAVQLTKSPQYDYKSLVAQVAIATDLIDGSEYQRLIDVRDICFAAELGVVLR